MRPPAGGRPGAALRAMEGAEPAGGPPERSAEEPAAGEAPAPRKQQGVKRHHHKHNLKHRYELQETLGKGTYGKVKRALERFSGRVVRDPAPHVSRCAGCFLCPKPSGGGRGEGKKIQ